MGVQHRGPAPAGLQHWAFAPHSKTKSTASPRGTTDTFFKYTRQPDSLRAKPPEKSRCS